jgi:hypothetical protein
MLRVTLSHLLKTIWTGFSTIGLQMDAICGKKLGALTFSGTELVTYTLWDYVNKSSQDLVITQLPHVAHQQKVKSPTH